MTKEQQDYYGCTIGAAIFWLIGIIALIGGAYTLGIIEMFVGFLPAIGAIYFKKEL